LAMFHCSERFSATHSHRSPDAMWLKTRTKDNCTTLGNRGHALRAKGPLHLNSGEGVRNFSGGTFTVALLARAEGLRTPAVYVIPLRCTQQGARVQLWDARGGQMQSNWHANPRLRPRTPGLSLRRGHTKQQGAARQEWRRHADKARPLPVLGLERR
jgi:hypothetical protein